MNIREKSKIDVENLESNLKLHYDAMQNELNTLIRNSIPNQMTNIKTLMWINVVFTAIAIKFETFNFVFFILVLSVLTALGLSFYAMMYGRQINYGVSQRRTLMHKVPKNKWSKYTGLHYMIYNTQVAIRYNGIIVIKRSRIIFYVLVVTFFSLVFLGLSLYFYTKDKQCQVDHLRHHQHHQVDQVEGTEQEVSNQRNKYYYYLTPDNCKEHISNQKTSLSK